jgi:hypothetical protein
MPSFNHMLYLSVDPIFESLVFLSVFPWSRVSANKKAPEPRVSVYWLNWSQHFERFSVGTMTWSTVTEYLCCKLWRICSICRKHFPVYSWLITGSVTRDIRWVPLVEKELLVLPKHLCSSLVLSGVHVSRYSGFCVVFCKSLFVLLFFYFYFWPLYCLSIYGFRLSLWYLQTLLIVCFNMFFVMNIGEILLF